MLHIKNFSFNPFHVHTILMWDDTLEGALVDPSCYDANETGSLLDEISKENVKIKAIWLTHGHFDHIYSVREMAEHFGVKVFMHPDDKAIMENNLQMASRFGLKLPDIGFAGEDLEDGQTVGFGETVFEVIHTPGHTPGCVCFYDKADRLLISGDTLFAGSIGRTDHMGGDYDKLIVSVMERLMGLDSDVDILPGHGPASNIGHERTHNPFLQPFNEPDETFPELDGVAINGTKTN